MTNHAWFRFYAELNDFLPAQRRQTSFAHRFIQPASIKDMIESLGVPHTEIDLILVNGESVDFSYLVRDQDRISVYPLFESLDITPLIQLRAAPLRTTRFVLDTHLGRLAAYLRMLGFDTLYRNDYHDSELAELSAQEQRIVLTRDRRLLMRRKISHGYFVRETRPRRQLVEVLRRFDLFRQTRPFTRCMHCNGLLKHVAKNLVLDRIPAVTRDWCDDYRECRQCGKLYWQGTHYLRMQALIDKIIATEFRQENSSNRISPRADNKPSTGTTTG